MVRELPHASRLEQNLLGSLLVYPEVMSHCKNLDLHYSEFFILNHQKIYQAMREVDMAGNEVEINSVINRLREKNELEQVGGMKYISELLDGAVSSVNTASYIHTIKNKAQLRNLIRACESITEASYSSEEEIDQILDKAEHEIMDITRHRRGADFENYSAVINRVLQEIEVLRSHDGVAGLSTGFRDLDLMTSGLHRGELIILAARPAMGKSAFALNLASNVAKRNQGDGVVALFSLEMPSESLIKRMLSCEAHVESEKLKTGKLTADEIEQLYITADLMSTQPIFIDDTSSIRVAQIFSKCRKLKSEFDALSLIVIDYLQLISGNSRGDSRQQEVSEISRNLKILAKEMDCPVIALSQLSRKVEERTNHEPMLSDLRESGSIEQDADIVMFLYRESYYDNKSDYYEAGKEKNSAQQTDIVDLSIAKHRNGSTGKIRLVFEKEFSCFSSADPKVDMHAI